MASPKQNEPRIGKAQERKYDLPFQKDIGTRYMMIVIMLMVFLAFLSVALTITLNALSARWTSGLEGKMTVEIPVQASDKTLRSQEDLNVVAANIIKALEQYENLEKAETIAPETLTEMVAPWLGDDNAGLEIPLPVLISVQWEDQPRQEQIVKIKNDIVMIDGASRLDTHKSWLDELLQFTGALKMVSTILIIVITLTTLMAVAGVVRARLAAHLDDVELLHLMGATDEYIARQFQRHIFFLSLKGCFIGAALGVLMIKFITWMAGNLGFALMPDFAFGAGHWGILGLIPFTILALCYITARKTLISALQKMP